MALKAPWEIQGQVWKIRKKHLTVLTKHNLFHSMILSGRICNYDTKTKTYTHWQYDGYEVIEASDIWEYVKKVDKELRGRLIMHQSTLNTLKELGELKVES
ncbi:hypothetical protein [Listeria newyorkensis]|uniref:Uncharacterized protein n=1 Tax=Listeria newyorkensis TaxID=1497681 RepID=A0A841Z2K8_9LIST|nr:hypothetical protein [Listeria newyorkensis]MBC1459352.1 hypothetical protein [Listeria newyorkensis]